MMKTGNKIGRFKCLDCGKRGIKDFIYIRNLGRCVECGKKVQ